MCYFLENAICVCQYFSLKILLKRYNDLLLFPISARILFHEQ